MENPREDNFLFFFFGWNFEGEKIRSTLRSYMRCSQIYIIFVVSLGIEADSVNFHIPFRCRPSYDVPPLEARISFPLKKKLQYKLHKHEESTSHNMNVQRIYSASIDHSSSADLCNAEQTVQENLCTFTDSRRATFFLVALLPFSCLVRVSFQPQLRALNVHTEFHNLAHGISHFGNITKTNELNAIQRWWWNLPRRYFSVSIFLVFFVVFCLSRCKCVWFFVFLISLHWAEKWVENHLRFSLKIQSHSQYFNMHRMQQHSSTQSAAIQTGI